MPLHNNNNNNNNCRPPPGQVYLTIGQDLFAVEDYLNSVYNASLHEYIMQTQNNTHDTTTTLPPPRRADAWPAAFMVYSDLRTLAGLASPTDYGSGVEYANGLAELTTPTNHNRAGLQIGLWLSGSDGCRAVVNGTWAGQVQNLVDYLSTAPFYRIFVRLGYEFDNPSFGYMTRSNDNDGDAAAALYTAAFRRVVTACRRSVACHRKTLWVWHSWGAGLVDHHLQLDDFYPGNDYVDWVGVSIFQQVYHHHKHPSQGEQSSIWSGGSYESLTAVLDFAVAHDKPVLIAESTPFGGIDESLTDAWGQWFQPVLDIIDQYSDTIAMWSYIDCDWNAQPMWYGVGFGDTRVVKNATIMQLWRSHVLARTMGYGSLETYCADDFMINLINTA